MSYRSPLPHLDVKVFPISFQEWLRLLAEDVSPIVRNVTAVTYLSEFSETVFANATAGAFAVNLPAVTALAGNRMIKKTIKKTDVSANAVTVTPAAGNTIEGAATYVLPAQYNSVTLYSNGVGAVWYIESFT